MTNDEIQQAAHEMMLNFAHKVNKDIQRAAMAMCVMILDVCLENILTYYPLVDRGKMLRHLKTCANPVDRTIYMLAEARLGHRVPLLD